VKPSFIPIRLAGFLTLALAALVLCPAYFPAAWPDDRPAADSVGIIEGESISVTGPMNMEMVRGQTKTLLRSGSDLRVKSGTARIELVEGGEIIICGPAHLSVLKSGSSLTVALDTGTIHVHLYREPALTVYTAQFQAQPVPVGDAPLDLLFGFDAAGAMCIHANRGAVRIEQQLTGQSVIIPEAGDIVLTKGQIDSPRENTGRCICELPVLRPAPPVKPEFIQLATPDTPEEVRGVASNPAADPPPQPSAGKPTSPTSKDEPIYQVLMPPLVYDPKAKVQPELDPKMIVLVRRIRVRPTLTFRGRVEDQTITASAAPPQPVQPPASAANSPKPAPPAPATVSFFDRVRSFFRKLWSRAA
jgi:hypothetical protein